MAPLNRSANVRASPDLPDAVGPAIRIGNRSALRSGIKSCLPFLICVPVVARVQQNTQRLFRLQPRTISDNLPEITQSKESAMPDGASNEKKTSFKRVLLKISGEGLMGDQGYGLHPPTVERIAREIAKVQGLGVEVCLVIGGGNIFRGVARFRCRGWIVRPPIIWACSPP